MKITDRPATARIASNSFNDLMRLWQCQPYSHQADPVDFLQMDSSMAPILHYGPSVTWVLNVRTGRYCFVSNNVTRLLGYPAHAFTKGGISFVRDIVHTEDAPHLWRLTKKVWDFILVIPVCKRKNYQFQGDYRVLKGNGSYIRLLEQTTVLQTDLAGSITHLMGTWTDISGCKKGDALYAEL